MKGVVEKTNFSLPRCLPYQLAGPTPIGNQRDIAVTTDDHDFRTTVDGTTKL